MHPTILLPNHSTTCSSTQSTHQPGIYTLQTTPYPITCSSTQSTHQPGIYTLQTTPYPITCSSTQSTHQSWHTHTSNNPLPDYLLIHPVHSSTLAYTHFKQPLTRLLAHPPSPLINPGIHTLQPTPYPITCSSTQSTHQPWHTHTSTNPLPDHLLIHPVHSSPWHTHTSTNPLPDYLLIHPVHSSSLAYTHFNQPLTRLLAHPPSPLINPGIHTLQTTPYPITCSSTQSTHQPWHTHTSTNPLPDYLLIHPVHSSTLAYTHFNQPLTRLLAHPPSPLINPGIHTLQTNPYPITCSSTQSTHQPWHTHTSTNPLPNYLLIHPVHSSPWYIHTSNIPYLIACSHLSTPSTLVYMPLQPTPYLITCSPTLEYTPWYTYHFTNPLPDHLLAYPGIHTLVYMPLHQPLT